MNIRKEQDMLAEIARLSDAVNRLTATNESLGSSVKTLTRLILDMSEQGVAVIAGQENIMKAIDLVREPVFVPLDMKIAKKKQ